MQNLLSLLFFKQILLPWCFHSNQDKKNPTLPKLITQKTIFQKENKRYSSEINMSEKFAEETHQAKEFSRRSRNLRERKKLQLKVWELNKNNRSKAIHTKFLPPVAASTSRRWVRGIPTALRWVPGSLPVLIRVKSFSN